MLTLQWQEQPESEPQQEGAAAAGMSAAADSALWQTLQLGAIPLRRPVLIRLVAAHAAVLPRLQRLLDQLQKLLTAMACEPLGQPQALPLVEPSPEANLLEVVVADGHTPVALQPRWERTLARPERSWLLPLLPATPPTAPQSLPPRLQQPNIAFWHGEAMDGLALTLLARAGVSDLDRRVFISYRRADTEPMAQQLFDALTRRNVSVFLDTVSVEPAVDFQGRLFEQLADKSMVVVLLSKGFNQSAWTRKEVEFAIDNELSLLILCLPGLSDKDLLPAARRGDYLNLDQEDLRAAEDNEPLALQPQALTRLVQDILCLHDLQLVARLGSMRRRTMEALERHGQQPRLSLEDAAIHLGGQPPRCSLVPSARPPGITELHDASTRSGSGHGPLRIVVGHAGSLPAERRQQMDWAIDGRNVQYCDVSMLDTLIATLELDQP